MTETNDNNAATPRFRDLGLPQPLLDALDAVGYESPSPIQAQTIPPLLEGRDVLGQAQTGTGKTAAFALPVLARLDLDNYAPQTLVLTPTRELAIQVAEAFQKYAAKLNSFHVVAIYGGQSYGPQLGALRRGVQVVVGTPGRVIDHMERGTLKLGGLSCVVLDEADEMLRMGFIDDVEKILDQTPGQKQVALFSATMPPRIRRIAQKYLKSPAEITIRGKTSTAVNIRQRYLLASGIDAKLNALTRVMEAEGFDGMIVFARTKQATVELAEKLEARGYAVAPLNGDIDQKQRERTVARLKGGEIDIVVATDVAARGLDVERISHVVNFDIPNDPESYVHRIGRTGRAGRSGEAILFVAPRERNMLRDIERATRQSITPMELPSAASVNDRRVAQFKARIVAVLADAALSESLVPLRGLVEQIEAEQGVSAAQVAAALAHLAQGDKPIQFAADASPAPAPKAAAHKPAPARDEPRLVQEKKPAPSPFPSKPRREAAVERKEEAPRHERRPERSERPDRPERSDRPHRADKGLETYRVEVGRQHGVKPGNIVGAIANEAGLDSQFIGRIQIFDDHSLVDLPEGMPKEIFRELQKVWVSGQQLQIRRLGEAAPEGHKPHRHGGHPKHGKPHHGGHGKPHKKRF